jgi:hypothetical protein
MNQRIQKLAEQAGAQPVNLPQYVTLDWQKFAELIVRECMDVAKYHTPDTEDCDYTWLVHNKIGKHFGVLE